MNKCRVFLFAPLAALFLLAGGCGGRTPAPVNVLRIGGVAPLTGSAATFGISTRNACQLYFDELNAAGGLTLDGQPVRIEFLCEDDQGTPEVAVNAFRKLIDQDQVSAIIGTVMSKCTLAGAPVAQAARVVTISPASTNEAVTKIGDYVFRACFTDLFQGKVLARYAFETAKVRRAAILYDNGNDYSKGLAETFKAAFTAMGGAIVACESFTNEDKTTDFSAQLTKIKAASPEILFVPCYYSADALIAKQARGLGLMVPLCGCDGWDSPDLVKLGGGAVEGVVFSNHYSKDDPRPEVQEFIRKYQARFNETPDALAALGWDAALILTDAIRRAGTRRPAAIREALAATRGLETVSGRVSFDAGRNPVKSAAILMMKDGRQTFLMSTQP